LPALSKERRRASARVGAITRNRGADDPELIDARRDLRAAEAAEYAEHIRRLVDTFPPLSAEQQTKIAALLCPVVSGEDGRAALARQRLTLAELTPLPDNRGTGDGG
jgi:hypothetical protein